MRACRYAASHVCNKRHGRGAVERCTLTRRECARARRVERATAWERDPSKVALTAPDVLRALERWHRRGKTAGAGWALFPEFRCAVGWRPDTQRHRAAADLDGLTVNPEARVDLYAVNLWPSFGCRLIAYEIKISRADFLAEIRHPEKRESAWAISTEYVFVTPQDLVKPGELPEGCGLYEVRYGSKGASHLEIVEKPAQRQAPQIHWRTFAALAQRVKEGR